MDEQISEWLKDGIVVSKQLCCDYRRLNEKLIRDNFPVAIIDDDDATLHLQNGFFHVPIEKDNRKYTAFVTHKGQF